MTQAPGVAVIGMACRFPGAENIDALWRMLCNGESGIESLGEQEAVAAFDPQTPGFVSFKGQLSDVDYFDAGFFGISPRDARSMDPQHRVWLECVWHALEDAGYAGIQNENLTGVFAACGRNTYMLSEILAGEDIGTDILDRRSAVADLLSGNEPDFLSLRTSYKLDLHGPSMVIQNTCASALVAVSQACQSLVGLSSDLCIAGGVQISFPQQRGYFYEPGGIRSPDGRVRTLDANANGTVFSDGVGVVILKRLDEAVDSGDRIYAVIQGWAINNDGGFRASMSAPSAQGQSEVISTAHAMAGFDPESVGYIELHGTGTSVGDAIELEGLRIAFGEVVTQSHCGLGSIKSNIGHLDAAAGIAGLIKATLMLEYGAIPASINIDNPRGELTARGTSFYASLELRQWKSDHMRRAGVSSFGVGGANCHVALEQFNTPPANPGSAGTGASLLTLSARSTGALVELAADYRRYFQDHPTQSIGDVCFTANRGRKHFGHRWAAVCHDMADATDRLASIVESPLDSTVDADSGECISPRIAFMFPGQDAARRGAGRYLYDAYPVFRDRIECCNKVIDGLAGWSLLEYLFGGNSAPDSITMDQCAGVSFGLALNALWSSWGITPAVVMGQSLGEITAACVAGVLDDETALEFAWERGRAVNEYAPKGAMMLVVMPAADLVDLLDATGTFLAAVNTPGTAVVAGTDDSVRHLAVELGRHDVTCRRLPGGVPYHCPLLAPVVDVLTEKLDSGKLRQPRLPLITSSNGRLAGKEVSRAKYWAEQLQSEVRLDRAMGALADDSIDIALELGAHDGLTAIARENRCMPQVVASLRKGADEAVQIKTALAALYMAGADPDWGAMDHDSHRRVSLPLYPFVRKCFRRRRNPASSATHRAARPGPRLLGKRLRLPCSEEIRFENEWRLENQPWLRDHRLFDTVVVPASAIVSMLLDALTNVGGYQSISDIVFRQPVILPIGSAYNVQLIGRPKSGRLELSLLACRSSDPHRWVRHVDAAFAGGDAQVRRIDPESLMTEFSRAMDGDLFYDTRWAQAAGTGPNFRYLDYIWAGAGKALGRLAEAYDGTPVVPLHPGVIEAGFQLLYCCDEIETPQLMHDRDAVLVPFRISKIRVAAPCAGREHYCSATITEANHDQSRVVGNISIFDRYGKPLLALEGFELRLLSRSSLAGPAACHAIAGDAAGTPATPSHPEDCDPLDAVRNIAADLAGIDPAEIKDDVHLGTLGIDSLVAISLRDEIQSRYDFGIPIDELVEEQTIMGLGTAISEHLESLRFGAEHRAGRARSGSTLSILKNGSSVSAAFLIAGDAITALSMRPLAAAISTDRVVGSLHVPGMDTKQAPPDSIESLADLYLADILRVQPSGPYTLIGRCTGGIVAYEIARKLQVLGEQVQSLVLVETLPFPGCVRPDIDQESIVAWHYHRQQEIRREIELRLENAPAVLASRCREIQTIIDRAVTNYAPEGVFDGDATLCRSEADRHQFQLLWGTLIQGRLTTVDVPGNHATMFEMPDVVHLGKVLSRIICSGK